jgi:hypothetical protein
MTINIWCKLEDVLKLVTKEVSCVCGFSINVDPLKHTSVSFDPSEYVIIDITDTPTILNMEPVGCRVYSIFTVETYRKLPV